MDDRVALVTGGSRGIGRAIVHRLVDDGWSVAVFDLEAKRGASLEGRHGEHVFFQAVDVREEEAVERGVANAITRFGRLDLLVNDAAIVDPESGPIERLSLDRWRAVLGTNLDGVFLCTKHCIPALRERRGSIVNLASTRAYQSEPHTEAYAASKGGVVALTHALSISLGPEIRVNAISPGWIHTGEEEDGGSSEPLEEEDHAQHPVGRVGRPRDVAALVAFLVSQEAAFITGQSLIVDGGMTRKMIYAE